jgi:hypothetical protein
MLLTIIVDTQILCWHSVLTVLSLLLVVRYQAIPSSFLWMYLLYYYMTFFLLLHHYLSPAASCQVSFTCIASTVSYDILYSSEYHPRWHLLPRPDKPAQKILFYNPFKCCCPLSILDLSKILRAFHTRPAKPPWRGDKACRCSVLTRSIISSCMHAFTSYTRNATCR